MAPAGALDRWLRRTPLEAVQQQSAAPEDHGRCDQQTAEPPSSNEQRGPGATLPAYFASVPYESDDMADALHRRRRRRHPCRSPLDWQLTGRMGSGAEALLHHRQAACYLQAAILETHSRARPILGGGPFTNVHRGSIQGAAFDSQGELLAVVSEQGVLTAHSSAALQAAAAGRCAAAGGAAALPPPENQLFGCADPLLVLDTHMTKLQAVRWNPADENIVGVASSTHRLLVLYDLLHTQGLPRQVLTTAQQSASAAVSGSTAVGLTDLAFFGGGAGSSGSSGGSGSGGGYVVLASGMGGQVFLWDCRAKEAPSATLAAGQGQGAAYAVQLSPDQLVVMAGMQSGEVKLWDLRGGSCSTLRFGGSVHHHPLLASVNLRHALTAVPGLAAQTAIPASAVHSMQLDPCDPRRLGFHLGCGWSGVLDLGLGGGTVTHLHAPPAHSHGQPEDAAGGAGGGLQGGAPAGMSPFEQFLMMAQAAALRQRRACWARDGRRYCVPSRRDDELLLLDFAATPAAGCYALRDDHGAAEEAAAGEGYPHQWGSSSGSRQRRQWAPPRVPPAVHLPLSQAATCAAAHPTQDLLVAGSVEGCLSVAGIF